MRSRGVPSQFASLSRHIAVYPQRTALASSDIQVASQIPGSIPAYRSSTPGGICLATVPFESAHDEFPRSNVLPRTRGAHQGAWKSSDDDASALSRDSQCPPKAALHRLKRFHWQDAPTEIALLLNSHEISWQDELYGFLCIPKPHCNQAGTSADVQCSYGSQTHVDGGAAQVLLRDQPWSNTTTAQAMPSGLLASRLVLRTPGILHSRKNNEASYNHLHLIAAGMASPMKQVVALLSADSVVLAVISGAQITRHKVLTGYTVRKQQGKAQLTHMRSSPGKNSVGGGIRMRETLRLFARAAERLDSWCADVEDADMLAFSGGVRVWNELYSNRNTARLPCRRDDIRWYKLPLSLGRPRYKSIERVLELLSHGEILTVGPLPKDLRQSDL